MEQVESFICDIGFPEQAVNFKKEQIDGISLLLLRRVDVLQGLSIKLGPALKIYAHINRLQRSDNLTDALPISNQSDNLI